ncbi:MAG: helix-turn-helix domain-containing protein [Acidobacteriales bacterium]|nr:helix-turn-helix domain-containing protein [Terriglobales bacterium]
MAKREKLTREEKERRRLAATRRLKEGFTQAQVAREFGVSRMTTCRWARMAQR